MSDTGTITEIEPEDGLGWIELENGDRVRFGGTSCKGFVPAIGMVVRVVSTRPGYGGTVKATALERVADAPKTFATDPKSGAAPVPRTSLHTMQAANVLAEDLLLTILGRADVDDRLHADLKAISFDIDVKPGLEVGCRNPFFFQVASAGGGNAFGIYAHPMFQGDFVPPWLFWEKQSGNLRSIAENTAGFFPALLATAAGANAATVTRLRADLLKLGMPDVQGEPHNGGVKAAWLPPDENELRPLDDYLGEADGGEMERGLLAHAFREGADPRAGEALGSIYTAWGWSLPAWAG